jgi:Domain of unknown function (DUF4193)
LSRRPRAADADGRTTDDGSTDVRVIERQDSRSDEHFTEGEPDLEAPEELAVLEVDEETALEEDLDGHVDHEDEVNEVDLEISLDHLVYDGDGDDDEDGTGPVARLATTILEDDPEIEDLEDREESLDRILREKLAGDEDGPEELEELEEPDERLIFEAVTATDGTGVPRCGPEEFVCRSCFLVRSETQRSSPDSSVCADCGG